VRAHRSCSPAASAPHRCVGQGDVQLRRRGPAPLHRCGLKETLGGGAQRCSTDCSTRGPSALVHRPRCFAYERPQAGRQRQFHSSVSNCWVRRSPQRTRSDRDRLGPADKPWESGICPGDQLPATACDRKPLPHDAGGHGSKPPRPARPEAQGRISTNPLRILDSIKSETQALPRRRTLLADVSAPAASQRFERVRQALDRLSIPYAAPPGWCGAGLLQPLPPLRSQQRSSAPSHGLRAWAVTERPDRAARWQAPTARDRLGPSVPGAAGVLLLPGAVAPAMHPLAAAAGVV